MLGKVEVNFGYSNLCYFTQGYDMLCQVMLGKERLGHVWSG